MYINQKHLVLKIFLTLKASIFKDINENLKRVFKSGIKRKCAAKNDNFKKGLILPVTSLIEKLCQQLS